MDGGNLGSLIVNLIWCQWKLDFLIGCAVDFLVWYLQLDHRNLFLPSSMCSRLVSCCIVFIFLVSPVTSDLCSPCAAVWFGFSCRRSCSQLFCSCVRWIRALPKIFPAHAQALRFDPLLTASIFPRRFSLPGFHSLRKACKVRPGLGFCRRRSHLSFLAREVPGLLWFHAGILGLIFGSVPRESRCPVLRSIRFRRHRFLMSSNLGDFSFSTPSSLFPASLGLFAILLPAQFLRVFGSPAYSSFLSAQFCCELVIGSLPPLFVIHVSWLVRIFVGGFSVLFLSHRIKDSSFFSAHCALVLVFRSHP
jgi:hypothetical protein